MDDDEALKLAIEALENNKRTHYYCEDSWYSCPKHEDGCANDAQGDECSCGADDANVEIDKAIASIKDALAQSAQEPVGKFAKFTDGIWREVTNGSAGVPLYTTPPQRPWVDLTEDEIEVIEAMALTKQWAIRMTIAQLKECNA